jgi:hypothetical protein
MTSGTLFDLKELDDPDKKYSAKFKPASAPCMSQSETWLKVKVKWA